jgi:hypothetical protein
MPVADKNGTAMIMKMNDIAPPSGVEPLQPWPNLLA